MQFFKYEGFVRNEKWAEENFDRRIMRERSRAIAMKSSEFNRGLEQRAWLFVSDAAEDTVTIGVISKDAEKLEKLLALFLKSIALEVKETRLEEVTFRSIREMLRSAESRYFIDDDEAVLEEFGLDRLGERMPRGLEFGEDMIADRDKEGVYKDAERLLSNETFVPELDRIYAGRSRLKAMGHPVHYMIETDDSDICKGMYKNLLQALYANDRLRNRRYCFLDFRQGRDFSRKLYDDLYKSCAGGAVVVRYAAEDTMNGSYAGGGRETIGVLCGVMKKYRSQVLTVFCLPRECTKLKDEFDGNLGTTSFVELREDFVDGERERQFLLALASENGVRTDKKLFAKLDPDRGYLAPELRGVFDEWYENKLKTGVYPQYKGIVTVKRKVAEAKPRGSAYDELSELIGLTDAKKVINRALNYYKAQKLFAEKGVKADSPAMHMVFTGNPGTAKTTVARLFARIMKENGLLSKGRLIEVGRGDLVGKYVGWTAPAIQNKFREAEGSVLFIDEAYSLVDDRDGSYGDEAINTIVQEMENHRDDMVVIFAGYPDKMERFLQKNPGLRSRIAYHVPFADYDTEELCEIANYIASKKGLTLTDEAQQKLSSVFDAARTEPDFGNGRYVRNVIEQARMAQADRLVGMEYESVSKSDIMTLCAEDIELPAVKTQSRKRIGFGM